jgi:hypothetical protein
VNPTKGFLGIFFKNSPYLEKKKLEVTRFRQCVPLGQILSRESLFWNPAKLALHLGFSMVED